MAFGAYVVDAAFLGDTVAFALGDGSVRMVDAEVARIVGVHDGAILAATPTTDGKSIVTGGDDGLIAATSADGTVTTMAKHTGKWIDRLATGSGEAIAYALGRQVVVLLSEEREKALDLPHAAGGLAFASKGLRLAIARYNGVTLWWPGTEAEPTELAWDGPHIAASFSPDGKYLVTAMQENQLHGWRLSDGKDMRMSGYPAKPRSLSWSAKGRFLVTSGANAAVLWPFHLKDGPQGKPPLQVGSRDVLVTQVACHPRKERVAIGYKDGLVAVADFVETAGPGARYQIDGPITALAWSRRGDRLAYGSETGAAGVVELIE